MRFMIQVKKQQEEMFELKNKLITINSKMQKLQHEMDTTKNVEVNANVISLKEHTSPLVKSFHSTSPRK